MLHTWVQYFEFFRARKGWQNLFQKHEIPVRKKHIFLAKEIWSQCHILRIIYVLYMYFICIIYVLCMYYICIICIIYVLYMYYMCIICVFAGFCWLFLGFLCPRVFLSVFLLALCGFSWVFCVRGDFCLCFCWYLRKVWKNKMTPAQDPKQGESIKNTKYIKIWKIIKMKVIKNISF